MIGQIIDIKKMYNAMADFGSLGGSSSIEPPIELGPPRLPRQIGRSRAAS